MARMEQEREDIMATATALVTRAEIAVPQYPAPIVIGFRSNGSVAIYVGEDPVYQFNSSGELRRLFVNDQMIKAEDGKLVVVQPPRSRSPRAGLARPQAGSARHVQLLRQVLEDSSVSRLLAPLDRLLRRLAAADETSVTILRQVPNDAEILVQIQAWIASLADPIRIARQPHAV